MKYLYILYKFNFDYSKVSIKNLDSLLIVKLIGYFCIFFVKKLFDILCIIKAGVFVFFNGMIRLIVLTIFYY